MLHDQAYNRPGFAIRINPGEFLMKVMPDLFQGGWMREHKSKIVILADLADRKR
jgi:hypothetical protein